MKVLFYETLTSTEPAVSFQLPAEKVDNFISYLGINDLSVSGAKVSFIDGQTVALISDDLKMPEIKLTVYSDNSTNNEFSVTYEIKCNIKYSYNGGSTSYNDAIPSKTVKANTNTTTLTFSDILQGGDLLISSISMDDISLILFVNLSNYQFHQPCGGQIKKLLFQLKINSKE